MFSQHLPLGESAGIFFGINGIEWLTMGYAEPTRALIISLGFGALLYVRRRRLARAEQSRLTARQLKPRQQ